MQQKKELEKYEARLQRIEQKFYALAERLSQDDPDLAKALRTAWQLPARSLAFRNADHQKDLKWIVDRGRFRVWPPSLPLPQPVSPWAPPSDSTDNARSPFP